MPTPGQVMTTGANNQRIILINQRGGTSTAGRVLPLQAANTTVSGGSQQFYLLKDAPRAQQSQVLFFFSLYFY